MTILNITIFKFKSIGLRFRAQCACIGSDSLVQHGMAAACQLRGMHMEQWKSFPCAGDLERTQGRH